MEERVKSSTFAIQLVRLLQKEKECLQFRNGVIYIPDPKALEKKLGAYFRHSKYTSFQRQLNNFGFNKSDKSSSPKNSVYVKVKGDPVVALEDLLHLKPLSVKKRPQKKKKRVVTPPSTPTSSYPEPAFDISASRPTNLKLERHLAIPSDDSTSEGNLTLADDDSLLLDSPAIDDDMVDDLKDLFPLTDDEDDDVVLLNNPPHLLSPIVPMVPPVVDLPKVFAPPLHFHPASFDWPPFLAG